MTTRASSQETQQHKTKGLNYQNPMEFQLTYNQMEIAREKSQMKMLDEACDVNVNVNVNVEKRSNKKRRPRRSTFEFSSFVSFLLLVILLIDIHPTANINISIILPVCHASTAVSASSAFPTSSSSSSTSIGISGYQETFDNEDNQQILTHDNASKFKFQRFQSSQSIYKAILPSSPPSFKLFQGKDGRKGYVSSTKLGGDWVLAQSKQVAVGATTEEVLKAYLNDELQERWNTKEVIGCTITCKDMDDADGATSARGGNRKMMIRHHRQHSNPIPNPKAATTLANLKSKYYQQDLVLKSQRVITSHTGIMKYSQTICIDQVGRDNYSVLIRLDDRDSTIRQQQQGATTTKKRPFDALSVHVALEQDGDNVNIYANGVMKVNRKVVPNLIIFDASGIAGSMSGKATLWLAPYFANRKRARKEGKGQ